MQVEKSLFENHEGEVFELHGISDSSLPLVLTEVSSPEAIILQRAREQGFREPFSLLFVGPAEPYLQQQMYTLDHPEIGQIELFLVPVDQDEKGFYYEAIFG